MAGRGGNCRKKGGLVAGQGRAPNRVPAGLQAVASLREVIFFVQPGAVVKKNSYLCGTKQLVGLSLAPCAYEESPGNTEHPTS